MKKRFINEAFRLQQLAGILPVNEIYYSAFRRVFPIDKAVMNRYGHDIKELQKDAKFTGFQEGVDYEWAVERDSNFPHALIVKNDQMLGERKIRAFIKSLEKAVRESGDPDLDDDPSFWNLSNDELDAIDAGADPDEVRHDKYNDPDAKRDAKYNR